MEFEKVMLEYVLCVISNMTLMYFVMIEIIILINNRHMPTPSKSDLTVFN
jgi:hypothetical protein